MKKNIICGLTLLLTLVPGLALSSSAIARSVENYTWIGPTGDPLPFESFQDAEEFLTASEVARSKTRREGPNKYKKVVLDHDGIWANSIFRWENVVKRPDISGSTRMSSRHFTIAMKARWQHTRSTRSSVYTTYRPRYIERSRVGPGPCSFGWKRQPKRWTEERRGHSPLMPPAGTGSPMTCGFLIT